MLAFLLVLCRINDGQNPNLRYETVDGGGDGEGLTPLEDLLCHWSTLVNMQVEDELVTEGQSLANVIKFEVKDKIIISGVCWRFCQITTLINWIYIVHRFGSFGKFVIKRDKVLSGGQ